MLTTALFQLSVFPIYRQTDDSDEPQNSTTSERALPLPSDAAAMLIGFSASQCVCLHWLCVCVQCLRGDPEPTRENMRTFILAACQSTWQQFSTERITWDRKPALFSKLNNLLIFRKNSRLTLFTYNYKRHLGFNYF